MEMNQINILVIDDNQELLDTIGDIIEVYGSVGHLVNCIEDALKVLEKVSIDLIISDINLSGESGFDLLKAVKGIQGGQSIPFIFITGDHKRETFRKGMTSGAQDFITKPFSPQELIESIDSLMAREQERRKITEQIDAKIKELSHVNSHDLRHSLSKFSGLLNLVNEDAMSMDECADYFKVINEEMESGIQRMNHILNNQSTNQNE